MWVLLSTYEAFLASIHMFYGQIKNLNIFFRKKNGSNKTVPTKQITFKSVNLLHSDGILTVALK